MENCFYCGQKTKETIKVRNRKYCAECIEKHFFRCGICNEYSSGKKIQFENEIICIDCLEKKDFYICSACGNITNFVNGYNHCLKCDPTGDDKSGVLSSSYKIVFHNFFGCSQEEAKSGKVRVYGFENEITVRKSANIQFEDCAINLRNISNLIYAKYDGSIDGNGFEIVSHPMTIEYLKSENTEKLFEEINRTCKSFKNNSTGLHIHVNKSSISNLTMIKLIHFFSNDSLKPIINTIAQRDFNHYSMAINKEQAKKYVSNLKKTEKETLMNERYTCINFMPKNTIEFRMFKGNTDKTAVIIAIEFVDCLLNYLEQESLKVIHNGNNVKDNFINYLKQNASENILKRLKIN